MTWTPEKAYLELKDSATTEVSPGFVSCALPPQTKSVTNHHYHIPQCLKLQPSGPNYLSNYTYTQKNTHASGLSENWTPLDTPKELPN